MNDVTEMARSRALARMAGKADTILGTFTPSVPAGRTELDNFTTNRVSLQEFDDARCGGVDAVLALSTAWACVNLLAGTIASLPLMVYRTGADGQRTIARDHPLYWRLHDSPNADQTAVDYWEFACACIEMQGNSISEVERRANGDVTALDVPFAPDWVTVRRAGDGSLEYKVSDGKRTRTIPQDRVLHIRGFGGSPLGGLSTLTFGRKAFGMALAIDNAASATFRNGIRPSGVLTTEKTLSAQQRPDAERLLREKYQGAMNAGVPMLLDNGVKWQAVTINPEDAQMLESRAFSVEEICRFFGVPPHMVGHTEKATSWGTGLEQQTLGFQKFTLRRRLKRIEQALEKQLLTARDRAQGVIIEFSLEGLLRADSTARATFYQAALGDTQKPGWMVRNEVRALENLPPVAGWDKPVELIQQAPPQAPAA